MVKLLFILWCLHTPVQERDALDNLKRQAGEMAAAFIKEDYKTFVRYTYPKIVAKAGGSAKMAGSLSQMMAGMKRRGMSFVSLTFDEPARMVKMGTELQCTVAQHTEIRTPDSRIVSTSTLLAFSSDNGRHWTFVDTTNKDETAVKKVIPNLSPSIVLPPQQPPVRYDH